MAMGNKIHGLRKRESEGGQTHPFGGLIWTIKSEFFVCHFIHTSVKLGKNIINKLNELGKNSFRYQYRERFLILLNSFLVLYCIYLTKPMNHAWVISSVRANSVTTALLLNVWGYPQDRVPAVGLLGQRVCINTLPHSQTRPKCSPKEIVLIYFPPQNVWACLTQKNCHTCDRRYYQIMVRRLEVQGKELEDAKMVLLKRENLSRVSNATE